MKKIFFSLTVCTLLAVAACSQETTGNTTSKQFMQINTVESVISGALGRSKMIITQPDGSQTETDLENLFSMVGINFGNIKNNEEKILHTLKTYTDEGWHIDAVTSFTLSPSQNSSGIFMTRYLLSKPIVKN